MHKYLDKISKSFDKGWFALLSIFLIIIAFFYFFNKVTLRKEPVKICPDCNVVLVSLDTLRADKVGDLTPNLETFSENSYVFENAVSVTSWTLPSMMSIFTSLYPSEHGVINKYSLDNIEQEEIMTLDKQFPGQKTLAQVFKENGYLTAAFTGGAGVESVYGFDKGFDIYSDDEDFAGFSKTIPEALSWIKQNKEDQFFVFLHGYDVHGQYVPEGGYDKRFVDFDYEGDLTGSKEEQKHLREVGHLEGSLYLEEEDVRFLTALYDEKVQRADNRLGEFLKEYESMGLMENTIFIITSDHGEELYEHGRIDHGHSLYDELIRVPLIIFIPNQTNKRILLPEQVRSIDIFPTVLELAAIDFEDKISGESLISLMQGDKIYREDDVFLETDYRYIVFERGVRTSNTWKLIYDLKMQSYQLFNLKDDPLEQSAVMGNVDKQKELYEKLKSFIDSFNN